MPRKRYKALDYLQYLGLRLFAMFVHMFDWEANYRTARWIGNLLYRFDRRHRKRAILHLQKSFPDWPENEIRRVAKASMRNMIYLGLEVLFTTRLITPGRWQRHISLTHMGDFVRLIVERRTGLICLTGHFGNWEVGGYFMAVVGFPVEAIARPLDNPYVNEYILGVREKKGSRIIDKRGAAGHVGDVLADRGVLATVADQDAGPKGVFVDFFGRKASTYKSIGLLAMQQRAPIGVLYSKRLDEEFHFEIGCERIIRPEEWDDKPDPLHWITQEYTAALERVIRRAPEQYLWVHRRWKHRPKGEPPAPDGIA